MKKKYFFLCLCVLLLTGCNATYELDIKEDVFTEKIQINDMNIDENTKEIYLTNPMPVDYRESCYLDYDRLVKPNEVEKKSGVDYYNIKNTASGLEASAKIDIDQYQYSRPLNYAFVNMHVNNYDNYISIYGFDGPAIFNMYNNLTSFDVIITTDKDVTDHNADEVQGNKYSWHFTKEDTEKELYIEMDSTRIMQEKEKEKNEELQTKIVYIIFISLVVIVGLALFIIKIKHHRNNKI